MDIASCLWQRRGVEIGAVGPLRGVTHALEGMYLLEALDEAARSGRWVSASFN